MEAPSIHRLACLTCNSPEYSIICQCVTYDSTVLQSYIVIFCLMSLHASPIIIKLTLTYLTMKTRGRTQRFTLVGISDYSFAVQASVKKKPLDSQSIAHVTRKNKHSPLVIFSNVPQSASLPAGKTERPRSRSCCLHWITIINSIVCFFKHLSK